MTQPRAARPRPSASTVIAVALILILAVVTVVSAVTVFQLPDPVTEQADRTNLLYQPVLAVSFLVFFGVTAGIIWAMFRYRRTGPELPEQVHGSDKLEMAWTIIPIIILVALFIPGLILLLDLKNQPSEAEADLVVEGESMPPNYDDLTPPALVVPVGKTVLLRVRSTDVIHSFYAPNTLYKIQAVPGNVNSMHFKVKAEDVGVYSGQCYQFCGLRHSDMRFVLDARAPDDYDRWLSETSRAQGLPAPNGLAEAAGGSD